MAKFYSELNAVKLGLVMAIIWSACTLIISLAALLAKTYAWGFINLLKSIYPGFGLTVVGIPLGVVYSFAGGFLFGFVAAWLYNKLIR